MKFAAAVLLMAAATSAQFTTVPTITETTTEAPYYHNRCVTGSKVYKMRGSDLLIDQAVETPCADPTSQCQLITYDFTDSAGGNMYVENGACLPLNLTFGCDQLAAYTNARWNGTVASCTEELCTGNLCHSDFTMNPPQNCKEVPEDDIALLPSCTMKEMLEETMKCKDMYLAEFPYDDMYTCSDQVDKMVECMAAKTMKCMSGTCPTILDDVPGIRQYYPIMLEVHYDVHSLDELLHQIELIGFLNSTTSMYMKELLMNITCPTRGVVPECVRDMPTLETAEDYLKVMSDLGITMEQATSVLSMFPCKMEYLTTSSSAYSTLIQKFYEAMTHREVCTAYDNYFSAVTRSFMNNCELTGWHDWFYAIVPETMHEVIPTISKALDIWGQFFYNYRMPNCGYAPTCVTGERVYNSAGEVLVDNTVKTMCGSPDSQCFYYDYNLLSNGERTRIESGICLDSVFYDCNDIRRYARDREYGTVTTCRYQNCTGSLCTNLTATPAVDCKATPEDDVQLFPSCTMKEFLAEEFGCFAEYYAEYPYESKDTCKSKLNNVVKCLSDLTVKCTSGRCPSVMDDIPGVRSMYSYVRDIVRDADSVEELMARLRLNEIIDEATSTMIMDGIHSVSCATPGEVPAIVVEWLSQAQMNMDWTTIISMLSDWGVTVEDVQNLMEKLPCNFDYFMTTNDAYFNMVRGFFEATSHQQVCTAYQTYFTVVTDAFNQGCELDKFGTFMYEVIPMDYHRFIPGVQKALQLWGEFWMTIEIPACDREEGEIDCSSLYGATTQCGIRKAWLCDYAKWKYDFLSTWLNQFVEYRMNNILDGTADIRGSLPACAAFDWSSLCKNSAQLRCFTIPIVECPMCMCADHEYKDLSGLSAYWRADYRTWQTLFSRYQGTFGSGTCKEQYFPNRPRPMM